MEAVNWVLETGNTFALALAAVVVVPVLVMVLEQVLFLARR